MSCRRNAPRVLRRQRGDAGWLEGHGVPFEGSLCPDKTSYPTNRHYLYYSGSELSAGDAPDADAGAPAPRGHRTRGRGTSGGLLYARLAAAVRRSGARVLTQTAAERLVIGPGGRVAGVACLTLRDAPGWVRLAHQVLHRWSVKPYLYVPKARAGNAPAGRLAGAALPAAAAGRGDARGGRRGRRFRREPADDARARTGRARRPAAGHAGRRRQRHPARTATPAARRRSWTGSPSGASSARRPPCWPACWWIRDGERVCDESRYGAALGDAIVRRGGRAWLLVDRATLTEARRQVRGSTLWFQRLQAWYLLTAGAVRAPTVAGVAARVGVDPDGLTATLAAYNAAAAAADPPPPTQPPRPGRQARRPAAARRTSRPTR